MNSFTDAKLDLVIASVVFDGMLVCDTINIKTQVFRLLRYYSPTPRKIARNDWATQNITHNMTSSLKQPYGVHVTLIMLHSREREF